MNTTTEWWGQYHLQILSSFWLELSYLITQMLLSPKFKYYWTILKMMTLQIEKIKRKKKSIKYGNYE